MALSLEQKHNILFVLGYPAKTIIVDSNLYNSLIADRLDSLDYYSEDRVDLLLIEIDSVRTKLSGLQDQGKLKQVGDIIFNTDNNDRTVKMEYKRILKELARTLDIPLLGSSSMVKVIV